MCCLVLLLVSGQPAQEPVVSKNGDIFEKRLIVKHLETHGASLFWFGFIFSQSGTCPITNEALAVEELIPIRSSNTNAVKPRPLSATSIPGMLQVRLRLV